MGQRHNHYEAAFEAWLRAARLPYVFVDETRRSLLPSRSLKSLDFIVSLPQGERLLIDVKGRRYPVSHRESGQKWTNWTPQEDLRDIAAWEHIFGPGFRGLLAFAYDASNPAEYPELEPYFEFRRRYYAFYGVWVDEYRAAARVRSPQWETVDLPARVFRDLRFPLGRLLSPTPQPSAEVVAS